MPEYRSASGSAAEDLFIDLFADTFGAEKAGYLYSQYPFYDIYQNARFADFVLENGATRVAIEIDDEASHNPQLVSQDKFYDDLLKQNSMIHLGWDVYRWAVRQMQKQPETVKDELRVFLGSDPRFKEIEDYLPAQQGRALKADQLELREYQQEALVALESMRQNRETIALLYHATGTGKPLQPSWMPSAAAAEFFSWPIPWSWSTRHTTPSAIYGRRQASANMQTTSRSPTTTWCAAASRASL